MFGFCLKTSDSSVKNGYYATEFSFMLLLAYGRLYSNGSSIEYIKTDLKQPALLKQIFSAQLDFIKKTIKFFLNGKLLAPAKEIDLKPEDAELMCPCVDLCHTGDKVSLVYQEVE